MNAPADAAPTRIALATSAEFPQGVDEQRLADELGATWAVWDDPTVDWDAFDLVVVRSVWDYSERVDEFLAWTRTLPQLANPADLLAWNADKRYLGELTAAGLPTVETRLLAPGEALADDDPLLDGELVVKPTVSAGARDTSRFTPDDGERRDALVARIHAAGRTAMVQPFVASVDERGESALLLFDGRFSHAIEKGRILSPAPTRSSTTAICRRSAPTSRPPTSGRSPSARSRSSPTGSGRSRSTPGSTWSAATTAVRCCSSSS